VKGATRTDADGHYLERTACSTMLLPIMNVNRQTTQWFTINKGVSCNCIVKFFLYFVLFNIYFIDLIFLVILFYLFSWFGLYLHLG